MSQHEKINYLEFPANDIERVKQFFGEVFSWSFVDYGPEYASFSGAGIDGGFFKSDLSCSATKGSALVVFYSDSLQKTLDKVLAAEGKLIKPIFSFPGGRRFHFEDPCGNEFAVWSDIED